MSNYAERLYEQFQKEKESFHRWLFAALLVVIFHAFVFQPYLSLLTELSGLKTKQADMDKDIQKAKRELENLVKAAKYASQLLADKNKYGKLFRDAQLWINSVDELEQHYDLQSRKVTTLHDSLSQADQARWAIGAQPSDAIIKLLHKSRPEIMQHYSPGDNCFFELEVNWVACQVERKHKPITDFITTFFNDRSLPQEYTALLKQKISENQEKYHARLAGALSQGKLKTWSDKYLRQEAEIISNWLTDMAKKGNEKINLAQILQIKQLQYQQLVTELDQRKQEFSRMGEIDTPIGPVKLGLHDILASIPFVGLFILSMLVKSISRQLAIRAAFRAEAPADETAPEALTLTMPVWLEPYQPRMLNLGLLGGFALLAIAALFGLWQVVTNTGLVITKVNINNYFLIALTSLTAVVFVILYVQLLRRYLCLTQQTRTAD
jgi:hypothetical protein